MSKAAPSRVAQRRKRAPKSNRPKRWVTVLKWLAIAFVVAFLAGIALFAWYAKDAPKVSESVLQSGGSSIIYDAKGTELTSLGVENRVYVTANEIPQSLKDAVVSIEDRRFYKEKFGVDPIRIAGAFVNNVTGKSDGLQGGSTLTQQLIKLSVFSTKASDQTIKRKAQEAWLAMQVEQKYSKSQILEYYINKVWMDNNQYGMATAAKYYFSKELKDLTLPQTALLAGMPQSPAGYDPYTHPQAAKERRDAVISAMQRDNKITAAQATSAKATPINSGLVPQKTTTAISTNDKVIDSYLTSVIAEVKKKMAVNPYTANLKIYTNVDMDAQKKLYDIVNTNNSVYFPDNKMQTAVTMTDPNTGRVIAQIGGRKTGDVRLGFNRATRNTRSNGSTMKPMMDYGPAIEYLNYSTYEQLMDTPYTYGGTDKQLYDWDKQYQGRISMRKALVGSRNVPAIRTLETVGVSRALNFLKGLGITLPKDQQFLSNGIGAAVTTEQEAGAYGAFANGGTYYKPYYINKVVASDGTVTTFKATGARAMKSSTAYMITDMLKGVLTSAEGTGTAAKVSGLYEAGKTGTTDYSDAELAANPALSGTGISKDSWFTGYTKQRVISVWTGYDKATTAGLNYDQQEIAQKIYKTLMAYEYNNDSNLSNSDWTKPSSVLVEHILAGSNPGTALTGSTAGTTRELYVRGYGPSSKTAAPDAESASSSASSTTSTSSSSSTVSSSSSSIISSSSSSIESVIESSSAATSSASSAPAPAESASSATESAQPSPPQR
ncbi:PBP1A family penicillin-binding protein [Lacticaseibacillus baoqingensis]|uniref:PBP1A family penicillin-binding protein n=1 Tax=Lacticaseibacillus baoqingensis TaxID=2486013 RepID=A0ABW4E897_9LACO|nr:PBP1A family penicillin-binding protein [Lacticaseibacillus baoqingensis]